MKEITKKLLRCWLLTIVNDAVTIGQMAIGKNIANKNF